jgi:hypothetical protein
MQGVQPTIFSIAQKSHISGAQYLHTSVTELTSTEPDGTVEFRRVGNQVGYAQKVYGNMFAPTSWKLFKGIVPAWSLSAAYDELWKLYSPDIVDGEIDPDFVHEIVGGFDLVISTVPLPEICEDPDTHNFSKATIRIVEAHPEFVEGDDNIVTYSGVQSVPWYRHSVLFGHEFWEFPYGAKIPERFLEAEHEFLIKTGIKPTVNNCTCHPNVLRAGRFGKWQKGVLTHHAGLEAYHAVHKLLQAG